MKRPTQSSEREAGSQVLDEIIDQITEKLRAGETLDLESYVRRYPELEDRLRRLLPGIQMLAALGDAPTETPLSEDPARNPSERSVRGVLGDYRIVREIGHGGMGVVYRAEQVSLGRQVALKVLPFASAMNPKQLQRFQNEARAAASLRHPNIVQVHSIGCERAVHFYAMDYVEGQTLAELIHHQRRRERLGGAAPKDADPAVSNLADHLASGRFASPKASSGSVASTSDHVRDQVPEQLAIVEPSGPPADETSRAPQAALSTERTTPSPAYFRAVAEIGMQVAEALDYAHQHGVIHRDVKPSNVILDNAGKPWVTDFGLARTESEPNLTLTGEMLGTLRYMSPEQIEARRGIVDHRTDIYSLGATLYELLALEPAFGETDRAALLHRILQHEPAHPRRVNKSIPPEMETIVLKALEKEPADRYGTAQEMADDLRRFLDHRPIAARRPSLVDRFRKWCRRNAALVAAAAPLWIVGAIVLAAAAVLITSERNAARYERELREQQERVAQSAAESIRRNRYAVNISLAAQAWNVAEFAKAKERLARCLSEDGKVDLRGVEWHYLRRLCDSLPEPFGKHDGPAFSACFSPDGRLLATSGVDGVRVWEYATGKLVAWLRDHTRHVDRFGFSPDGRLLAVQRDDQAVGLWDTSTWKVWKTIRVTAQVRATRFTPDGKLLWVFERGSIDDSGTAIALTFFDTATWEKHWTISDNVWGLTAGAVSPDGKQFAMGFVNGVVQLWDLAAKKLLWSEPHTYRPLSAVAFSPAQPLLFTGSLDGDIFVRDLAALSPRPLVRLPGHRMGIESLEFAHPGNRLVSASRDRTIRVWELLPGDTERVAVTTTVFRDDTSLFCVCPAPDGHTLASVNVEGVVRRWDVDEPPECRRLLLGNDIGPASLHFSPSGDRLFAPVGRLRIYDTRTGAQIADLSRDQPRFECTAISPGGRLIAAATERGPILVWDAPTYRLLGAWQPELRHEPFGGPVYIGSLTFSPDSKSLVVARAAPGSNVPAFPIFIDPLTGQRLPSPLPPNLSDEGAAHAILFSPDGRWTVRRLFQRVQVFETATWQLRFEQDPAWPVAFSPQSDLVATAGEGVVRVWRTAEWTEITGFVADHGPIEAISFSADGRTLATGSSRGAVRLWNVATGRELMTLADDMLTTYRVAFSPDGSILAASGTAAKDVGELRIWNLVVTTDARKTRRQGGMRETTPSELDP